MTNPRPLKRELPNQFGADARTQSEQELWKANVCAAFACPRCRAPKGVACTRKGGKPAFRCHPERSRKFIAVCKQQAARMIAGIERRQAC